LKSQISAKWDPEKWNSFSIRQNRRTAIIYYVHNSTFAAMRSF